jgi:hypothetical protein
VACSEDGIACFDRIRYRRHDGGVFLYAFDLIELDGEDLRRDPLAVRKATLASLLRRAAAGLRLNDEISRVIISHLAQMPHARKRIEEFTARHPGLPQSEIDAIISNPRRCKRCRTASEMISLLRTPTLRWPW